MRRIFIAPVFLTALTCMLSFAAEHRALDSTMHHLRRSGPVEWADFPAVAEGPALETSFSANRNDSEYSLRIRQQDVKQAWHVSLNGKRLGQLRVDENDMVVYFAVPAGILVDGENRLRIAQDERSKFSDDIRVGEIELNPRPVQKVLDESAIEIEVRDGESDELIPARLTILGDDGAMRTVAGHSDSHLAIRPGIVYTADGRARIGLPAGRYTIYAGRGFEYSLASTTVELTTGEVVKRQLAIRREVPTHGYVACDTHVHTLTHSGHGDATIDERMITLAGEGIELPIATDHNIHIDYEPTARAMHMRKHFTPVTGNEVTTPVGHFNVFPINPGARIPNHKLTDWPSLFDEIYDTPGVKAVILNHARDLHSGVRPFGPLWHHAVAGENLRGWSLRANAMEVVNSGATQTDVMQLFHDWMAMLNRGWMLTPVGASDSHDVGRHFVGQGRTYIRARDEDPGTIDVNEAVDNFVNGHVMVSYGLLAELTVDGQYRSGDLVPVGEEIAAVSVRVLGPHWVRADSVELFANGKKIHEKSILAGQQKSDEPGVKWTGQWMVPRSQQDVHLVAIARGPGVDGLYWKTAKPYQPQSTQWKSHVVACSGAVWLDGDGDGRPTPALAYAKQAVSEAGDLPALLDRISQFDEAVAIQAALLWHQRGNSLSEVEAEKALAASPAAVQAGFQSYLMGHRENERARLEAGK